MQKLDGPGEVTTRHTMFGYRIGGMLLVCDWNEWRSVRTAGCMIIHLRTYETETLSLIFK